MVAKQVKVFGAIDNETRCVHYHSETDRIAIKCYCCKEYYPCLHCHQEQTKKQFQPWPEEQRNAYAVLCGACKTELTINEYLTAGNQCPNCRKNFNPNCALHYPLYFKQRKEEMNE
ncbi:CHY zinc finger protein [Alkalicoccus daliensis]|uniref:Uncharacterized protein, contains Zn-finger domain of CHY type n=1 Tax=Alkalicoccus daliensis TaxID=745820 RepID=A0A1H0K986_9BACI|nr:CHY zinc finger protein [Alkalicoccus daliensis]SDO52352.1 Uncharacterized protein, contains Zn-finger domain of CHY type [Alkalicoccus daliensis]